MITARGQKATQKRQYRLYEHSNLKVQISWQRTFIFRIVIIIVNGSPIIHSFSEVMLKTRLESHSILTGCRLKSTVKKKINIIDNLKLINCNRYSSLQVGNVQFVSYTVEWKPFDCSLNFQLQYMCAVLRKTGLVFQKTSAVDVPTPALKRYYLLHCTPAFLYAYRRRRLEFTKIVTARPLRFISPW